MQYTNWNLENIANILRSLALSNIVPSIPQDERYQAGFQSALLLVAVALGIPAAEARTIIKPLDVSDSRTPAVR